MLSLVQGAPAAAAPFVELAESGLTGVRTTCGEKDKSFIVEVNGGGLALGDFDANGTLDLVVVDGSTLARVERGEPGFPPRLFLNDGAAHFSPAGAEWEMSAGRWGMGAATGDVDGDGHLDLFVAEWGRDRLFRNRGGAGLDETSAAAGFVGEDWSTSAAFLDYDRDGDLDLSVVNYLAFDPGGVATRSSGACRWKGIPVLCGPEGLEPVHDQLYRNKGDGNFEDVSEEAGLRTQEPAFGLGAMTLDLEADGDTDLFIANDSMPNHLWENLADGTLRGIGLRSGVALDGDGRERAGMGIACGDLNDDLLPDLFVTNFSGEANSLYLSARKGLWRERAAQTGLGGPSVPWLGWGTALEDFDLDGDLDVALVNGHVYPEADVPGSDSSYAQEAIFHRNDGARFATGRLSDAGPRVARVLAGGELDGDGRPDLVVLELGGPVRVLVNSLDATSGPERHYLRVRLAGRGMNRAGIGARVLAEWEGGRAVRELRTAGGFQAAVAAEASFGLGSARRIRRLIVQWPSGARSELEDVEADRVLVVPEPEPGR